MNKLKNIQEPFVIILVGHPLCGKTTLIRKIKELYPNSIETGTDKILMDNSNTNYTEAFKNSNFKEIGKIFENTITEYGKSNNNIIIDMTNLKRKRRKSHLSHFPNHYKVSIVFPFLDKKEYMKRNENRNRLEGKWIPEKVIEDMIKSYESPSKDEGFDKIIVLN
jgi:predicted kinase